MTSIKGKIDISNWDFDFGEAINTEVVVQQLQEGIENSLVNFEPNMTVFHEGDDLVLSLMLPAFGDDGPEFQFRLSELLEKRLMREEGKENKREAITCFKRALLGLIQRLTAK